MFTSKDLAYYDRLNSAPSGTANLTATQIQSSPLIMSAIASIPHDKTDKRIPRTRLSTIILEKDYHPSNMTFNLLPNEIQQMVLVFAAPPCLLSKPAINIIESDGDLHTLSARDRSHIKSYWLPFGFLMSSKLHDQWKEVRKGWTAAAPNKAMGIDAFNQYPTGLHLKGSARDENRTVMLDLAESEYYKYKLSSPKIGYGAGAPEYLALQDILKVKPVYMANDKWLVKRIITRNKNTGVFLERSTVVGGDWENRVVPTLRGHPDPLYKGQVVEDASKTRLLEVTKKNVDTYFRTDGDWETLHTGLFRKSIWYV